MGEARYLTRVDIDGLRVPVSSLSSEASRTEFGFPIAPTRIVMEGQWAANHDKTHRRIVAICNQREPVQLRITWRHGDARRRRSAWVYAWKYSRDTIGHFRLDLVATRRRRKKAR